MNKIDSTNKQTRLRLNKLLFIAARNGSIEDVRELFEMGAEINAYELAHNANSIEDNSGQTVLDIAVAQNDVPLIVLLLHLGASPDRPDLKEKHFNECTRLINAYNDCEEGEVFLYDDGYTPLNKLAIIYSLSSTAKTILANKKNYFKASELDVLKALNNFLQDNLILRK